MLVAVLAVSLFRHWKLPAMLGYLFAGTLIGPYSFGIVPDTPETRHLAEFGVVFLMFSIGLEFSLPKLHAMRRVVFGLGLAQVGLTMLGVMGLGVLAGYFLEVPLSTAFVLAGAAAMSSGRSPARCRRATQGSSPVGGHTHQNRSSLCQR